MRPNRRTSRAGSDGRSAGKRTNLLTEKFILDLHRRMLKDVRKWAGKFRRSERNIGINWWLIPAEVRGLLDEVKAWMVFKSYAPDEIAVRFHHRLVAIHPFPNGNGRHARLIADLIVMRLGGERFTWGSVSLHDAGETRQRYIQALRAARTHMTSVLCWPSRGHDDSSRPRLGRRI